MTNRNPNPGNIGALPSFGLQPIGSTGASNYDLPASPAGEIWSRTLGQAGAQLGEWALASARSDAVKDGAIAGLDPGWRPEKWPRLQEAAYNAAALKSYQHSLETKTRLSLAEAQRNYDNLPEDRRDPRALLADLDKRRADLDKDVFDEVRPNFVASWDGHRATLLAHAQADLDRRTRDQAFAATLANAQAASDTAHRVAALPAAKDGAIAGEIAAHDRIIDDAVNQNQMTAAQAELQKQKFRQSVASTRALALFDNLPDAEKKGALERFRAGYAEGDYFAAARQQESGGDDNARSDTSSAGGRYGFTAGTWRDVMRAHPELGLTEAGRFDGDQQEAAMRAHTGDNRAALQRAGLEASNANLYMAHFLGAGAATRFLREMAKNPQADAAALFPEEAKSNPTIFNGRTLALVYELQTRRFGGPSTRGLQDTTFDHLVAQMDQRVRRIEHEGQIAQRAALHEIAAAKKQIAEGYDVTPDEWTRLTAQYAASPDETTRAAFEQAGKVRAMVAGFVGKPPQEVEAQIANMQAAFKDGGTAQEKELVADASAWLTKYRKDISSDPVQRFARDFGQNIAPVDFSSPAALSASLSGRVVVADQAAKAYGLPQPKILLESERAAFKTLAANGGHAMAEAAGAAMKALGPRGADLLREIGGDAPAFAAAARVSSWGGDPEFVRDFAEWHRLSSDPATKKALEMPRPEAANQALDKTLGPALLAMPELNASVRVAARQAFEVRALRNGWDKSLNDGAAREELSRAAQQALGATYDGDVQYGGVATRPGWWSGFGEKVLAPLHMRADRLNDALAAITDDDLASLPNRPTYADGRPVPARVIAGSYLQSRAHGLYEVLTASPLQKDTKSRGVLDLNALEGRLRPRVAGAWK